MAVMYHVTKYSPILGVFQQPWPGVSPTAILNEEKALGRRLGRVSKFTSGSVTLFPGVRETVRKKRTWKGGWWLCTEMPLSPRIPLYTTRPYLMPLG